MSAPVAAALAGAFHAAGVSGRWDRDGLVREGRLVLESSPRWLGPLAEEVLAARPRAPVDAPRELARLVSGSEVLQRAEARARRTGRPLARVRTLRAEPTGMGRRPWDVPRIPDLAALSELLAEDPEHVDWLADTRGMGRRAAGARLRTYRHTWLPRPGRNTRLLEAPRPRLLAVQRTLLRSVLARIPVHDAAHGFVPGRSAITGARVHVGAPVVLSLDLESFFASLAAGRVYGVLRSAGYPEAVAHTMTGLCTTAAPVAVLRRMPPGGAPDARFRLRSWLAHPHCPQGAPTSPALANLCAFVLDRRLAALAGARGLAYTRYADDLTFSGSPRSVSGVVSTIASIVVEEGFVLNAAKTRTRGRGQRQTVTGIVVNSATNAPREEFDRLKAVLHDAARHGLDAANRERHPDFAAHLLGRISWVGSLSPARGERLRAAYERIADSSAPASTSTSG